MTERVCPLCHRPNTEQGQRGPRRAHQHCRKVRDEQRPVAPSEPVTDRLLDVLDPREPMTQLAALRAAGIDDVRGAATLRTLVADGLATLELRRGKRGRPAYLYRLAMRNRQTVAA